ncbi:MAG TPA: hypothetical protein VGY98_00730, partial [Verrucomicrobiae bacterium]|nr:hypothetical protein [Verrucomicrobiae bacterium]
PGALIIRAACQGSVNFGFVRGSSNLRRGGAPAYSGLDWVYMDTILYFSFHILAPQKALQYQAAANLFLDILVSYVRVFGFKPIHHCSDFQFIEQSIHSLRF